jgi:hypothetical protein
VDPDLIEPTTATETRFELSDAEKKRCLDLLFEGRDMRDSYALLWPTNPPAPYAVFMDRYTSLVVWYYGEAGKAARSEPDDDERKARRQLSRARDIMFEALEELAEMDVPDDNPLGKYHVLPKLASALEKLCAGGRASRKADIEKTAAMHSLLAANAERDRE